MPPPRNAQAGREYCSPDTAYVHEGLIAARESRWWPGEDRYLSGFFRKPPIAEPGTAIGIFYNSCRAAGYTRRTDFGRKSLYSARGQCWIQDCATFPNPFLEFYSRGALRPLPRTDKLRERSWEKGGRIKVYERERHGFNRR